jgi:hypothetical protein
MGPVVPMERRAKARLLEIVVRRVDSVEGIAPTVVQAVKRPLEPATVVLVVFQLMEPVGRMARRVKVQPLGTVVHQVISAGRQLPTAVQDAKRPLEPAALVLVVSQLMEPVGRMARRVKVQPLGTVAH